MRKILFVDDDPNVLKGFKRILRPIRHEYEMHFVDNGAEALERLAAADFDVIVSDMRMPGMDGAELLLQVRDHHPALVRIVLSSYGDHKAIMRTVRLAHQYLTKPCEAETLKTTIEKTFALRKRLHSDRLRRRISKLDTLPSLPTTYTRITELLKDPEVSIQAVAQVIGEDVGMSLKILQIVNSAFFGLARRMSSAEEAVVYLGIDTVRALVLTIGIFASFEESGVSLRTVEEIYEHSLKTAGIAKAIALRERLDGDVVEDAYIAGLLHDLGKLIMAQNMPASYAKLLEAVGRDRTTAIQTLETQIFEATHEQIGAYLIGLWGLPDSIVEAVAFHHAPELCPEDAFNAAGAVHLADAMSQLSTVNGREAMENRLSTTYLERAGLRERLEEWIAAGLASAN